MISIRITGYGSEYRVEATCEKCGQRGPYTFDLGSLSIKRLEEEPAVPGENAFAIDLPVTKKRVTFKILTGRDQEDINAQNAKMRAVLPDAPESGVTAFLEKSIVSVGDVTDRTKIGMFVKNMPARDARTLRNRIKKIEPGIDMTCDMTCTSCGEASRVDMPIGPSFLWPDAE
jgi:RNase P subunit RPR2